MDYSNRIQDFADRTLANITAIDALKVSGGEVYEFTQLVNSLLGLIVFPQQEYLNRLPSMKRAKLLEAGWPLPSSQQVTHVKTLSELLRHLRNGITHFGIQFDVDQDGELWGVTFQDWDTSNPPKLKWQGSFDQAQIRTLGLKVVELLKELPESV